MAPIKWKNCQKASLGTAPESCAPCNLMVSFTNLPIYCNGSSNGTIYSAQSGGALPYTYLWSNGKTTRNINLLMAGTYTLTVTDNNGCQISGSETLVDPPLLEMTVTANSSTSATINATGGTPPYTYNRTGALTFVPTPTFTGLTPGSTYLFKTKDDNNCQKTVVKKMPTSMAPPGQVLERFENENPAENQFAIFPNPTSNLLNITFANEETMVGRAEIFNQIGQNVLSQNLKIEPGEDGVLNIGHLPEGAYFLVFKNENGGAVASERFVKI